MGSWPLHVDEEVRVNEEVLHVDEEGSKGGGGGIIIIQPRNEYVNA